MNFISGQVTSDDGQVVLRGDAWELPLAPANAARARASSSGEVILGVRHGHVRVLPDSAGQGIPGRLYTVEPTGDVTFVHVYLGSSLLVASTTETFRGAPDEPVRLEFDQAKRNEICKQINRIIYDDQPYCFLYHPQLISVIHKRFKTGKPSPLMGYDPRAGYEFKIVGRER